MLVKDYLTDMEKRHIIPLQKVLQKEFTLMDILKAKVTLDDILRPFEPEPKTHLIYARLINEEITGLLSLYDELFEHLKIAMINEKALKSLNSQVSSADVPPKSDILYGQPSAAEINLMIKDIGLIIWRFSNKKAFSFDTLDVKLMMDISDIIDKGDKYLMQPYRLGFGGYKLVGYDYLCGQFRSLLNAASEIDKIIAKGIMIEELVKEIENESGGLL